MARSFRPASWRGKSSAVRRAPLGSTIGPERKQKALPAAALLVLTGLVAEGWGERKGGTRGGGGAERCIDVLDLSSLACCRITADEDSPKMTLTAAEGDHVLTLRVSPGRMLVRRGPGSPGTSRGALRASAENAVAKGLAPKEIGWPALTAIRRASTHRGGESPEARNQPLIGVSFGGGHRRRHGLRVVSRKRATSSERLVEVAARPTDRIAALIRPTREIRRRVGRRSRVSFAKAKVGELRSRRSRA